MDGCSAVCGANNKGEKRQDGHKANWTQEEERLWATMKTLVNFSAASASEDTAAEDISCKIADSLDTAQCRVHTVHCTTTTQTKTVCCCTSPYLTLLFYTALWPLWFTTLYCWMLHYLNASKLYYWFYWYYWYYWYCWYYTGIICMYTASAHTMQPLTNNLFYETGFVSFEFQPKVQNILWAAQ